MSSSYNPDVLNCLANLSNDEVFTPPVLANQMLDLLPKELFSSPDTTFLDPFCKSGVFLREIVKRLDRGLQEVIPDRRQRIDHILHHQVFGIAITELTSYLSRRTVYCSKTADGKHSVSRFANPEGNIQYRALHHTWEKGKCRYCGASQEVYDRGDQAEQYAYQFIHTDNPEKLFNMKFDVIIGNPPYQLSDGGNSASAMPIYQLFVEQSKKLNPHYLCMIMPSRWFAGGKGLDSFRFKMLNDDRVKYLKDFVNAKDCFPETSIGGGVCYFLWQSDFHGECEFVSVIGNGESTSKRKLNRYDIFVRYNDALSIIEKVPFGDSLSKMMLSRNPFGITSSERGCSVQDGNKYALYSSKGVGYIEKNKIMTNMEYANSYKIMISKVTCEHAGEPDKNGQVKLLSSVRVLKPKEVCTDSYLIVGKYDRLEEAMNLLCYLKTKFARFLILQAVTSINLSKEKFQFVPIQDFSHPWTDEMLYKKYNLTDEEIAFIESMIRPME